MLPIISAPNFNFYLKAKTFLVLSVKIKQSFLCFSQWDIQISTNLYLLWIKAYAFPPNSNSLHTFQGQRPEIQCISQIPNHMYFTRQVAQWMHAIRHSIQMIFRVSQGSFLFHSLCIVSLTLQLFMYILPFNILFKNIVEFTISSYQVYWFTGHSFT